MKNVCGALLILLNCVACGGYVGGYSIGPLNIYSRISSATYTRSTTGNYRHQNSVTLTWDITKAESFLHDRYYI